jgi:hypothetical protein
MITDIIRNLLQQLVEKIDRIRLVAGSMIQEIVDNLMDVLPDFPARELFIK